MSRSLQFDIVANDKASAKLKEVQGAASQFARSLGGMVTGMLSLQAVVGRVIAFGMESFNWAAGLKESASAVGLTVVQLQQLDYAAGQSGVSVEKMQKAFLDLRKTMRDAQGGNMQSVAVLKALGYSQDDIASGNIDVMDAFLRVSRAISAASTEQEKFNIATAVFGDKVAMELLKVLGDYAALKQSISQTPLISDQDADRLDRYSDRLDRLTRLAKVLMTLGLVDVPKNIAGTVGLGALATAGELGLTAMEKGKGGEVTQQDKDAAAALALAGRNKTNTAGNAAAAGQPAFSALAQIGGAAGAVRGVGATPELTALEKIEENTRPETPIPANGSTNFSTGQATEQYSAYLDTVRAAKNYRRKHVAPR